MARNVSAAQASVPNMPAGNRTFTHMRTRSSTYICSCIGICSCEHLEEKKNINHLNVNKNCETMQWKVELALLRTTPEHAKRKISSKIKCVLERKISSNRRQAGVGAMVKHFVNTPKNRLGYEEKIEITSGDVSE